MPTTTTPIRPLTVVDLPEAVPLLCSFYALEHPGVPFDPDRAVASWTALLQRGLGVLLGAYQHDALVGVIGLCLRTEFYNARHVVSELVWWLEPAARGGTLGLRLLEAAEAWARAQGAHELICGRFLDGSMDALDAVYRRRGFVPFGIGYRKEVSYVRVS